MLTAHCVNPRTGAVGEHLYTLPQARSASPGDGISGDGTDGEPVRKPRPDLTQKGVAIVGDLRTDALHRALREQPIDDDRLIGMLVLALAGRNVTVKSGVAGLRPSALGRIGDTLTEGGVLTRDLDTLRHAAREALVEVLSCRENHSASGMGARHAGAAIDADAFLPNMATEEFLPSLSRAALEACAGAHAVAVQPRARDTRAAMLKHFANGTFVYSGARFALAEAEREARRDPASTSGGTGADGQDGAAGWNAFEADGPDDERHDHTPTEHTDAAADTDDGVDEGQGDGRPSTRGRGLGLRALDDDPDRLAVAAG